ncbi:FadR/GntR family transcriptional regulator [Microbacterium sp. SLBN-146]|uniref:FadR/GntR family transcriptional regulator n=1 Tax=Microbacterium sp. SLBN-146 TaxID=2768457 RepID=UPI00114FD440|nr:FCD domain-containing protein [Microbacterium sp. SLBN-146]TQJ31696.1 DNA-binding FadR family transcriptional regulator [Microbacterium sp. SLBN-146]
MARKSLVSLVADELLDRIIAGESPVGAPLPSEAEIGESYDVSRVTVREALRVLSTQGIIRVTSGIGSLVAPLDEWQSLNAILRYRSARGDDGEVAEQLIAVRRMFETEAAALAATRLTPDALAELQRCIDAMTRAADAGEVDGFVEADLRFHDVILRGSENVFLAALFEPLTRVLAERRAQTSRVPEIQRHAIAEHTSILAALREGDASRARAAMDHHMQQTLDDLHTYVLSRPS